MVAESGGNGHKRTITFRHPPKRVISLVPSMTESMFDLGLGDALVGVTDYCIHPAELLGDLPRLGGTQDPHLQDILALEPDLVLANWEENTRQAVEALEARGLSVWVTFPKTVQQALDVLWTLVGLFQSQTASIRLQTLELTLEWAISAAVNRSVSFFSPIWYEEAQPGKPWWMTFNRRTYCHDLLYLLGGQNVFAERQRLYPLEADLGLAPSEDSGERDTRYPRVTLDEIRLAQPEVILLPDEPFAFREEHRQQLLEFLGDTPAGRTGQIHLVDGTLITWHGTRLAHALRELPSLLDLPH